MPSAQVRLHPHHHSYLSTHYLSMSSQPSKAEFIAAILVEVLTVIFISLSLIIDEGGNRRRNRPGIVTAALDSADRRNVFTTNPNYSIGGEAFEEVAVVVEAEEDAESSGRATKVDEERREGGSWIAARREAGERQKSEELRRAYARMWESGQRGSRASPNVGDVELDALTTSGRLCRGIAEADASPRTDVGAA